MSNASCVYFGRHLWHPNDRQCRYRRLSSSSSSHKTIVGWHLLRPVIHVAPVAATCTGSQGESAFVSNHLPSSQTTETKISTHAKGQYACIQGQLLSMTQVLIAEENALVCTLLTTGTSIPSYIPRPAWPPVEPHIGGKPPATSTFLAVPPHQQLQTPRRHSTVHRPSFRCMLRGHFRLCATGGKQLLSHWRSVREAATPVPS